MWRIIVTVVRSVDQSALILTTYPVFWGSFPIIYVLGGFLLKIHSARNRVNIKSNVYPVNHLLFTTRPSPEFLTSPICKTTLHIDRCECEMIQSRHLFVTSTLVTGPGVPRTHRTYSYYD